LTKTWFITGSASGIGAELTRPAIVDGYNVVATDLNAERLNQLFCSGRENLLTASLDICDEAQAHAAVDAAIARFGRIDVLVNNAGHGQFGLFEEIEVPQIEKVFATNQSSAGAC
jgi:NAD(P)-dependent dehydrogenase (short-subunit alcohol dehydrogenase family)